MEDWLLPLQQGDIDVAWDRFLSSYRRLIFATIRHYTRDHDDGMDLFAHACERLRADDMRRVRARADAPGPQARFSTWLVVVVRHLIVDWYRHRDGRPRLSAAAAQLPPIQRRILELVLLDGRSHVEAYGVVTSESGPMAFGQFLRELREAHKAAGGVRRAPLLRALTSLPDDLPAPMPEAGPLELRERRERLATALETLPPTDRAAVELYFLEELPADRVADLLGLPNAKAVYNRVYRALAGMRAMLEGAGLQRGDL